MRVRHSSLMILLYGLLASLPAVAGNWPATTFQVVGREPTPEEIARDPGKVSMLDQATSLMAEVSNTQSAKTRHAAGWFDEITGMYRRVKHLPPPLGPIVDVAGTQKYRVYAFPYGGSRTRNGSSAGGSYETNTCFNNNKIPWLSINYDLGIGRLPSAHYRTIGHELMHSLMFGAPVLNNCNRNSFEVSEGIPDGASLYLMNKRFPGYSGRIDNSNSSVGMRSYRIPLFIFKDIPESEKSRLEKITGYATSSFWRFIAERFGGLEVFPHFLASPIKTGASHKGMYMWLDERLQKLPGLQSGMKPHPKRLKPEPPGLYEVYPAFVTEFASYGGSRYKNFNWINHASLPQARDAWLRKAFGGCKRVTLTPGKREQVIPISVSENAAKCFRVVYSGFSGNVNSSMEILADNLKIADQLHLGWAWKIGPGETENCYRKRQAQNSKWTPCIYKAFTQTGPKTGSYARTWPVEAMDFGDQGGGIAERIFVLSNVAVKPWLTQAVWKLNLKIGVCTSTANGKPAEPMCHMHVPRVRQKPVNPAKPIGKEELYGLETDPPAPDTAVKGLRFGPYSPNRSKGAKAVPGGYGVVFHKLEYGYTGAVTGIVTRESNGPNAGGAIISSSVCKDPAKPIGKVIQSDEDALRISLDADLCEAGPGNLKQCENGCPVVDHLTAEVNIPFGWRQFSETAPTDIRTPGIERYINTMPDSLEEAMNFGANTALPDLDVLPGNSGTGGGSAGNPGSSTAKPLPCACTCAELAAAEAQGMALRRQIDAGGNPSMAGLGNLTRCSVPCQKEYMICRMDADRVEKQQQELLRQQKVDALNCDCSCGSIAGRHKRAQALEKNIMSGAPVSEQIIFELSHCASKCQQEMIDCAVKGGL